MSDERCEFATVCTADGRLERCLSDVDVRRFWLPVQTGRTVWMCAKHDPRREWYGGREATPDDPDVPFFGPQPSWELNEDESNESGRLV